MDPTTLGFYVLLSVGAIGFGTAGALVATRQPSNAIGWLFLLMAFGYKARRKITEVVESRRVRGKDTREE
jgi:hypothetical protein